MAIVRIDFTVTNLNSAVHGCECLSVALEEGCSWCGAFREIASKKIPICTVNSATIWELTTEKTIDFDVFKKGIEKIESRMKERPLSEKIPQLQEFCNFHSGVEKNPLTWGLYTENLDYQSYKHQINGPAILLCPENIIKSIQGMGLVDDLQEILALVLAHECAHYYLDTPEKATLLGQFHQQNPNEKDLVQAVMEESLANAIAYACNWENPEKWLKLLSLQAINYRLAIRWLNGSLLNPWFNSVVQDWRGEVQEERQERRKGLLQTLLSEPIDPYNTPVRNELRYWPFLVKALLYTCADLDSGFQIILKSSSANQAMIKDLEGPSMLNELFRSMRAFYRTGEPEALIAMLFDLHVQYGLEMDSKTLIHELNQLRILNPANE